MNVGPHAGYIFAAYAFTALVIGTLIARARRDHTAQKRALARFQDGSQGGSQDGAGVRP
ncbi:heme exporter protein CcmD [Methylobacterium sp. Leaf113]|uniref:heme exporter protein CcmD n=1 Tax=Methylobacterium sp. Leaf113 TaxID=1736259 RepID=UPI0009EC582B|nr:heme exporter protein CcmD [Methylobacterium sp. Leaf113]